MNHKNILQKLQGRTSCLRMHERNATILNSSDYKDRSLGSKTGDENDYMLQNKVTVKGSPKPWNTQLKSSFDLHAFIQTYSTSNGMHKSFDICLPSEPCDWVTIQNFPSGDGGYRRARFLKSIRR